MAIVNHFYNETTRRYIALFGSLFNKLSITRDDNQGNEVQRMVVPLAYGPYQKFLARVKRDPNLNHPSAITLPRMSFEITSMSYDGTRKVNSLNRLMKNPNADDVKDYLYSPAPYNLEFNLYVMTKYAEDGTKVMEQVLPYFKPEYTFTAFIIDDLPAIDIPLILNSVSAEDIYDGDFETRRSLMWTLSFTLKGFYFGPNRESKVIKFATANLYPHMNFGEDPSVVVTSQPGLTANGEPTTDIEQTIPYFDIEESDNWDYIDRIYHPNAEPVVLSGTPTIEFEDPISKQKIIAYPASVTQANPKSNTTWRWYADDVLILGESDSTYIVRPTDPGKNIYAVQVETNTENHVTANTTPLFVSETLLETALTLADNTPVTDSNGVQIIVE
jgi:hypothetical protein